MSLIDAFKETCCHVDKFSVPDGEGGTATVWRDGAEFEAAVVVESSVEARIAEAQGVAAVYTVTTDRNVRLDFHDVFRRLSDGQTFRVTSDPDDGHTPDVATFQFNQVSAERWALR